MKKLFLVFALVCVAGINQLFAANPIPSYNVLISGRAVFQEMVKPVVGNNVPDERRQMNIETTSSVSPTKAGGFARTLIVTTVFALDGHATLGPYYLIAGQSLKVSIDEKAWGVNFSPDGPAYVSVWIN